MFSVTLFYPDSHLDRSKAINEKIVKMGKRISQDSIRGVDH